MCVNLETEEQTEREGVQKYDIFQDIAEYHYSVLVYTF